MIWHLSLPDGLDSMNLKATVKLPSLISAALPQRFPCCFFIQVPISYCNNSSDPHIIGVGVQVDFEDKNFILF